LEVVHEDDVPRRGFKLGVEDGSTIGRCCQPRDFASWTLFELDYTIYLSAREVEKGNRRLCSGVEVVDAFIDDGPIAQNPGSTPATTRVSSPPLVGIRHIPGTAGYLV
jgi:hypothetical protein